MDRIEWIGLDGSDWMDRDGCIRDGQIGMDG